MRAGEVAQRARVSIGTLRYYERRGLLPEPARGPGGHRPTLLHVTNGDSAGNTLRQTSLGGAVLPWQDVLHEGPVPAGPRRALLRTRAAFLAGCGWGGEAALLASLERRDQQFLQALRDGCQVVLWFEHDLYDQLQLIDALALAAAAAAGTGGGAGARVADGAGGTVAGPEAAGPEGGARGAGAGTLELIVVGGFPGRPSFRGLGELTADELETLWPARVPAGPGALATATFAWEALRRPDPAALAGCAVRTEGDPELPFLAPALRRLLEELPAPGDGLSGTERRALQAIAAGAATPGAAFLAAQDLEEAPFYGDAWFFRMLSSLGRGANRLIETSDGQPLGAPPPLGDTRPFVTQEIRLTKHGRQVRTAQADRLTLLPIDRWAGGTHLTQASAWRWDPATRQLTPPG